MRPPCVTPKLPQLCFTHAPCHPRASPCLAGPAAPIGGESPTSESVDSTCDTVRSAFSKRTVWFRALVTADNPIVFDDDDDDNDVPAGKVSKAQRVGSVTWLPSIACTSFCF